MRGLLGVPLTIMRRIAKSDIIRSFNIYLEDNNGTKLPQRKRGRGLIKV